MPRWRRWRVEAALGAVDLVDLTLVGLCREGRTRGGKCSVIRPPFTGSHLELLLLENNEESQREDLIRDHRDPHYHHQEKAEEKDGKEPHVRRNSRSSGGCGWHKSCLFRMAGEDPVRIMGLLHLEVVVWA